VPSSLCKLRVLLKGSRRDLRLLKRAIALLIRRGFIGALARNKSKCRRLVHFESGMMQISLLGELEWVLSVLLAMSRVGLILPP
jgi:hypothetical protein